VGEGGEGGGGGEGGEGEEEVDVTAAPGLVASLVPGVDALM
jgi:hypothetical protein